VQEDAAVISPAGNWTREGPCDRRIDEYNSFFRARRTRPDQKIVQLSFFAADYYLRVVIFLEAK